MTEVFPILLVLDLFLFSIIFIVAAFALQKLSEIKKWQSNFLQVTKNALIFLSIASIFVSVMMYFVYKPF